MKYLCMATCTCTYLNKLIIWLHVLVHIFSTCVWLLGVSMQELQPFTKKWKTELGFERVPQLNGFMAKPL